MPLPSPKGYTLTSLRKFVWSFYDGYSRSLILYSNRQLTIVDAPRGFSSRYQDGRLKLASALEMDIVGSIMPRKVHLVYSVKHLSYVGNMGRVLGFLRAKFGRRFDQDVEVYVWGSSETKAFFAERGLTGMSRTSLPAISMVVGKNTRYIYYSDCKDGEKRFSLRLGNVADSGDLAVYLKAKFDDVPSVLHLHNLVTVGYAPWTVEYYGLTIDLYEYIKRLAEVRDIEFDIFSGGYGPLGNASDINVVYNYTMDMIDYMKDAAQAQGGALQVGPAAVDTVSEMCRRKLVQKYGCSLGGVAVTAASHCLSALLYNSVDVL